MLTYGSVAGLAVATILGGTSGCAALHGTRPQDMTIAGHQEAAYQDQLASTRARERAQLGGRGAAQNRAVARTLDDEAAEHLAAAGERTQQVEEACRGVASPAALEHLTIASVGPIIEADTPRESRNGKGYYPERLQGARIVGVAAPGVPAAELAGELRCEAERLAAGEDTRADDPMSVRPSTTMVQATPSGVVVEIRSKDSSAAREVFEKATRLSATRR